MNLPPLRDLLHRVRWDPAFGHGAFELAYWDRSAGDLVRVPLSRVVLEPGSLFLLILEPGGASRRVPLHRVRQVSRDGALLWERVPPPLPTRQRRPRRRRSAPPATRVRPPVRR